MLHKEFWGLLFLAFVVWIFLAGNPSQRIENACRPIGWTGNAVTSLAALALPSQQENSQKWFNKFEYGCQYMTWRLFYQEAYNKYMAQQAAEAAAQSAPAASAAASAASAPVAKPASPAPVAPPSQPAK